jgi:uncharacterized protein (DUF1800 family)
MKGSFMFVSRPVRHHQAMAQDSVLIAHLLRRTGFGPHPGQVAALVSGGYAAALEKVLEAQPIVPDPPTLGTKDDEGALVRWWLEVLARPEAGLHEKMVWFWHGLVTSSLDKAEPIAVARQHLLFRSLALGNARELLQKVTVDAAMLGWLDGSSSTAEAPNENYAREVMELFALGLSFNGAPTYTQADVLAGAYALSGWEVDSDKGAKVSFNAENGPNHAVTFLGKSVRSANEVIDTVCDQPAFANHIAGRLYQFFHGEPAAPDVVGKLAADFRSGGLEIRPLVAAILRDPSFVEHRLNRPRFPIEWLVAADATLGTDPEHDPRDLLATLGQMPFGPPNVAGWPVSPRWLSAGAAMTRTSYAVEHAQDTEVTSAADPVAWMLERASMYEVSDATKAALTRAASRVTAKRERASVLHALAVSSPEFALA